MALPSDAQNRKDTPVTTGVLDYFPDAIAEVARVSKAGNDQHNPGQPLHWAKEKSTDHADCIVRHLLERGTLDSDGMRHTAKVAWRALALLQTELEQADMRETIETDTYGTVTQYIAEGSRPIDFELPNRFTEYQVEVRQVAQDSGLGEEEPRTCSDQCACRKL